MVTYLIFKLVLFLLPKQQLPLQLVSLVRYLYLGSGTITSLLVPATAHHSTPILGIFRCVVGFQVLPVGMYLWVIMSLTAI